MEKNLFHDWLKTINAKMLQHEVSSFDGQSALETLTAGLAPLKAFTVLQMEMIRWSSRRAQAILSIPQRLSGCKTQQDVFQEQKRFWETAYAQNQEALERMVQVWSDFLGMSSTSIGLKSETNSSEVQSLIKFPSKSIHQEAHNSKNTPTKPRTVYSS